MTAALALCATGAVAGCGEHDPGVDEPAREGLALDVGGIDYNTFITRELNLAIQPDKELYDGPPAERGSALYGIFIQACNNTKTPKMSTDDFVVEDNQGNEFEPIALSEKNPFAYNARQLDRKQCIPETGGFAQQGPTAGAMLLFKFPTADTENRPLELTIKSPDGGEKKHVELDL